jgi:hypothetical protein
MQENSEGLNRTGEAKLLKPQSCQTGPAAGQTQREKKHIGISHARRMLLQSIAASALKHAALLVHAGCTACCQLTLPTWSVSFVCSADTTCAAPSSPSPVQARYISLSLLACLKPAARGAPPRAPSLFQLAFRTCVQGVLMASNGAVLQGNDFDF